MEFNEEGKENTRDICGPVYENSYWEEMRVIINLNVQIL
jgi:hypothetical protein